MAEQKTNVMRLLDQKKIKYTAREYPHSDAPVDGVTAAALMGQDPARVFKTLVARGASKKIYVFDIPAAAELDLKKAAKAVGEKSIAMVHVSEITALTGYVRGGCSPVGMRKRFPTLVDETAQLFDLIHISGGRRGLSLVLAPDDLVAFCEATYADITREGM